MIKAIPMGLSHTNGSLNLSQKTRPYNNQQKIVDFAVLANDKIKLKGSEKKDKYLSLARELKNLWNMKVKIIPIVIGAFWYNYQKIIKGTGRRGG